MSVKNNYITVFIFTAGILFLFPSFGFALDGHCVANCGGGSSSSGSSGSYSGGSRWTYSGPSRAEIRENKRRQEAHDLNEQGNTAYNNRDYETAIYYYEKAANKNPADAVIADNLHETRGILYNQQGNDYYENDDWQNAVGKYEEALKYLPNDRVVRENFRQAQGYLDEELEKRRKEEEKRRTKETIENIIVDFNDEFRDAPRATSLSFQKPSSMKKEKEGLQFKKLEAPKQLKPMKMKFKKQEDYYKTLQVKDIPEPKSTQQPKSIKVVIEEEKKVSKLWSMISNRASEFQEDASQWAEKKKEDFRLWTYSESFDQTFGRFPGVSKFKSLKEEAEQQYDDMLTPRKNWLNRGMEGAREGAKHMTNPYDGGAYADEYYDGIDALGQQTNGETEELIKKEIKKKVK